MASRCGSAKAVTSMSDSIRLTPTGAGAASAPEDDWKTKALLFRAQRQTLLASNIANADTPHYRARDMDFSAALEQATRAVPASRLATTSPQHLSADVGLERSTLEFAQFVQPAQTNLDGNTVDLDLERAAFAQNAILYQLAITSLDDELKEFKQASSDPRR